MVRDAIGRKWQLGTVQLDYNLPERFQLEYTGADNQKHRPVMIHRAPFGSMERFVAILIEHCAGQFPLWLTPEQVRILPVSEKYNEYAKKVANTLEITNEKVGKKIREAELAKVTYMLVVGENEMLANSVSARKKGEGDLGVFSIEDFATMVNNEVASMLKEI
ncbi:MAG: threonine--tRNA ligase [Bacteroidota bacterium]